MPSLTHTIFLIKASMLGFKQMILVFFIIAKVITVSMIILSMTLAIFLALPHIIIVSTTWVSHLWDPRWMPSNCLGQILINWIPRCQGLLRGGLISQNEITWCLKLLLVFHIIFLEDISTKFLIFRSQLTSQTLYGHHVIF